MPTAAQPGMDVRGDAADLPEGRDNPMYAMLMPQPRLVRLLEKRARDLGVDVRWGHELVGIVPGPSPSR